MPASPHALAPDPDHPFYWRFRGQTRPLLGGSVEDNLFQIPDVEEQLDLLRSVGGNYVRCTMSSRDPGDEWPFDRQLQLNDACWQRFDRFIELTHQRDIVVQIELWDRFDFAREPWQDNPFNPKNNDVYTAGDVGLEEDYPHHPASFDHPFFRTVPELDNHTRLLGYQQAQVDRMLQTTLPMDHVLYCMDNETKADPAWGAYWSRYIQKKAKQRGGTAFTTEMWDQHVITHADHDPTFLQPELYPFIDCSQNNQRKGQEHWDNLQARRSQLLEKGAPFVRPMNNVKVYGADGGPHGNTQDGLERFWRALLGGVAAVRFHRPPSGQGIGELAQQHIRAARAVCDAVDLVRCAPRNDLLPGREEDRAYCTADPGRAYAVLLTRGGDARVEAPASVNWRRFDLKRGAFVDVEGPSLTAPDEGLAVFVGLA